MFKPLAGGTSGTAGQTGFAAGKGTAIVPVPPHAPPAPKEGPKGEKPALVHEYRGGSGDLLGFIMRFDRADGSKDFRPLVYAENADRGARSWRWQSWSAPRPLYGLDRLAARPGAPVVICEGEKATDAAGRLLPDWVALTSSGGSKSAGKADWTPLAGRSVMIWPDADEPGTAYAAQITKILRKGGAAVQILTPPTGVAAGWDAADAEAEGMTQSQVAVLIEGAASSPDEVQADGPDGGGADEKEGGARRGRRRNELLDLIGEDAELWHDEDRRGFATVKIGEHWENLPLSSRSFRIFLAGRCDATTGSAFSGQALEDAIRTLESRAIHHGARHRTYRRVGEVRGRLCLDLGGPEWAAVEVDAIGWRTVSRPGCKFIRSDAVRALPFPVLSEDGLQRELSPFLNVASDADFKLVCSWLVAALWPSGPYPILAVAGEQGSGKSTFSKMLRGIVDPNKSPIRATPENLRDLVVSAENSWFLCYDNLSGIAPWLSDALCRLSTGSGFAARELHTDRDEAVFDASRPILLNGIPDLAGRPDLQDRTIGLTLPSIPEEKRQTERETLAAFEKALPAILGALLDGLVASIRNLSSVSIERPPRMADFARIAVAAAPGLGWTGEEFLDAYDSARRTAVALSLEASPLAAALQNLVKEPGDSWKGSPTELLDRLDGAVSDATRKLKQWPHTPNEIGAQVRRLTPPLRAIGVQIETDRVGHDRRRVISITRAAQNA